MKKSNKLKYIALLTVFLIALTGCPFSDDPDSGEKCAECESDTDCNEGLRCYYFSDGKNRCASSTDDKCSQY